MNQTNCRRSISENSTPLRRRGITSLRQEFALKRPLGDLLQTDNKSPGKENSKTSICSTNNLERIKRVKSMKDDVRAKKSAKGTLFHYGFWKETCAESNEEILAKPVSDKEISIKLALQRCKFSLLLMICELYSYFNLICHSWIIAYES